MSGPGVGLAIEAATEHVEVLVRDDVGRALALEMEEVGHGHTRRLTPLVARALERAGVRVGDLAVKIAALFNVPLVDLKRAVGGSVKLVCDNSLLKKLTGWAPKVSFDEGLAQTVEWFQREHGW